MQTAIYRVQNTGSRHTGCAKNKKGRVPSGARGACSVEHSVPSGVRGTCKQGAHSMLSGVCGAHSLEHKVPSGVHGACSKELKVRPEVRTVCSEEHSVTLRSTQSVRNVCFMGLRVRTRRSTLIVLSEARVTRHRTDCDLRNAYFSAEYTATDGNRPNQRDVGQGQEIHNRNGTHAASHVMHHQEHASLQ